MWLPEILQCDQAKEVTCVQQNLFLKPLCATNSRCLNVLYSEVGLFSEIGTEPLQTLVLIPL